eukprot:2967992-Pleurochrysis_carterae.AAC.4
MPRATPPPAPARVRTAWMDSSSSFMVRYSASSVMVQMDHVYAGGGGGGGGGSIRGGKGAGTHLTGGL